MKVSVLVETPAGASVRRVHDVEREGDLERALGATFSEFRITHPDIPLTDSTVRIEHA